MKILKVVAIITLQILVGYSICYGQQESEKKAICKGYVLDKAEARIAGAEIFVKDVEGRIVKTSRSNEDGSYDLELEKGSYKVEFSSDGFIKQILLINLFDETREDVKLTQESYPEGCALRPTPDENSKYGAFIPKNIEECFEELNKILPKELIKKIRMQPRNNISKFNDTLGLWIRDHWDLSGNSSLATYFFELGIKKPEEMSSIVLKAFWHHLKWLPV